MHRLRSLGLMLVAALFTIITGNGTAELTTVEGGKLWVTMKGKNIILQDEKGGMAMVTIRDVYQSNGVIHVIDHVVMPK